jgi:hypothetical protein
MNGYGRGFFGLPPVVKNIIIINVIMLAGTFLAQKLAGLDLIEKLALYFPKSELFRPYQIACRFLASFVQHVCSLYFRSGP